MLKRHDLDSVLLTKLVRDNIDVVKYCFSPLIRFVIFRGLKIRELVDTA
jgi:hypothetical protein